MTRKRKRRGAPLGNQNGRKHGFYSKALWVPQENDSLPRGAAVEELDRAIAITRMTIRSLVEEENPDHTLISYNISLLHRLIRTRERLSSRRNDKAHQAVERLGRQLSTHSGLDESK